VSLKRLQLDSGVENASLTLSSLPARVNDSPSYTRLYSLNFFFGRSCEECLIFFSHRRVAAEEEVSTLSSLPARVNDSPSYILRLSLLVVVGAMAYSCLDSKSLPLDPGLLPPRAARV
jgi:hypothetical protein